MLSQFESYKFLMITSEIIKDYITDQEYLPKKPSEIFSALCPDGSGDYAAFFSELEKLIECGEAVFSKKGKILSIENSGFIKGTFRSSTRGFGFVAPGDIFIPPSMTMGAIGGDTVIVEIIGKRDGESPEGRIVKITERAVTEIIGTVMPAAFSRGKRIIKVRPDSKRHSFDIIIDVKHSVRAFAHDKAVVKITEYPSERLPSAKGVITSVLGRTDSIEANYEAILIENKINLLFGKQTLAEADEVSKLPILPDGRLDLRDRIIFTIDGADAKDLDDAISIEKTDNGYILGVHIADVSHYVGEGTALDTEAIERGTSVYFADKVIPMLPKSISNGCCSLNPDTDKYTLSVFVNISSDGIITGCDIAESIIRSTVRGVYSELNDVEAEGKSSQYYEKYSVLFPDTLPIMLELYRILENKSKKRGALDLETSEARVIVGEDGMPADIVKRESGVTEKLIEQFMLAANEAVACWLYDLDMPCVYRIHEKPSDEKMHAFALFCNNLGLDITPLRAKNIYPSALCKILAESRENNICETVSPVMLRSLMKAKYSSAPSPHFGLAIDRYCHFTSPIRRYPDLAVHRIIKTILHGEADGDTVSKLSAFSDRAAVLSSENELRAISAERAIDDLYKTVYMKEHIGEIFDGVIASVTSFGIFVQLENTCEGFVPLSSLDGYYEFDEASYSLYCGKQRLALGDRVSVRIVSVDVAARRIEMELTDICTIDT